MSNSLSFETKLVFTNYMHGIINAPNEKEVLRRTNNLMQFLLNGISYSEFNALARMLSPQDGAKNDFASAYALKVIDTVRPEKHTQAIAQVESDIQKLSQQISKIYQPPPQRIPEVDSYLNARVFLYSWGIWD